MWPAPILQPRAGYLHWDSSIKTDFELTKHSSLMPKHASKSQYKENTDKENHISLMFYMWKSSEIAFVTLDYTIQFQCLFDPIPLAFLLHWLWIISHLTQALIWRHNGCLVLLKNHVSCTNVCRGLFLFEQLADSFIWVYRTRLLKVKFVMTDTRYYQMSPFVSLCWHG